jgi:hypothetical protein
VNTAGVSHQTDHSGERGEVVDYFSEIRRVEKLPEGYQENGCCSLPCDLERSERLHEAVALDAPPDRQRQGRRVRSSSGCLRQTLAAVPFRGMLPIQPPVLAR